MNLYKYHNKPEQLDGYEDRIFHVPELAYDHAIRREERLPEAEPVIMKSPRWAYRYAKDIMGDRWSEAEPHIMQEPVWTYLYARYVIKGRWPEAETSILEHPFSAFHYAISVIGGRWDKKQEEKIKKDPFIWKMYKRKFRI